MLDQRYYRALDRFLRNLAAGKEGSAVQASTPFAGKVLVLIGDTKQLPPVTSCNVAILEGHFKSTEWWAAAQPLSLDISERMRGDPEFAGFLEKVATNSKELERAGASDEILMPEYLRHHEEEGPALAWLHGEAMSYLRANLFSLEDTRAVSAICEVADTAYVCSINERCAQVNDAVVRDMRGQEVLLPSENAVLCDGESWSLGTFSSDEFLSSIRDGAKPPGQLRVCVGTIVFVMANMSMDLPKYTKCVVLGASPEKGAVKLIRVADLKKRHPSTHVILPPRPRDIFYLPRIKFEIKHQHLTITRTQCPIAPAFAYTVHKCQGQTLRRVLFDVKNGDIFSHGMLYVGCSRVRGRDDIRFLASPDQVEEGRVRVHNIVLSGLAGSQTIDTHYFSEEMSQASAIDRRGLLMRQLRRDKNAAAPEGFRTERVQCRPRPARAAEKGGARPEPRKRDDSSVDESNESEASARLRRDYEAEEDSEVSARLRRDYAEMEDSELSARLRGDWSESDGGSGAGSSGGHERSAGEKAPRKFRLGLKATKARRQKEQGALQGWKGGEHGKKGAEF